MKIVVVGLAKSGTTGFLYKIKNSLSGDIKVLFERKEYNNQEADTVIAKCLLGHKLNIDSFAVFDKKILIVRDPRDRMISSFLYLMFASNKYESEKEIKRIISLLIKKEKNPSSISFVDLAKTVFSKNFFKSQYINRIKIFNRFYREHPDYFIVSYEDFIDNKLGALEDYLGFKLNGSSEVASVLSRVVRTKSYGSWKNWFTKEDVIFFKDLCSGFMLKHGFFDWELNKKQEILPEHCSDYVIRVVNDRRRREGLLEFNFNKH
jgi:hypothetical protein